MNTKKCMTIVIAIILVGIITAHTVLAKEVPPKNRMVVKQEFKNVADNSWSNLELEQSEPSGLYYIEMTDVKGSWGSWGSKKDPYPDGTAWQNEAPLEKSDLRLQYRLKGGTWKELIAIPPQGAIGDNWFPFEGHGNTSLGQTFTALEEFDGVGLQTPTWVTNNSGGILTLYAQEGGKQSILPHDKLATAWGRLKGSN